MIELPDEDRISDWEVLTGIKVVPRDIRPLHTNCMQRALIFLGGIYEQGISKDL